MSDVFDRMVALRPEVPDELGWAQSPAGRAVLARVHRQGARKPSWWTRRRFVVPTVMIGLGGAIAGGAAFATADRTPDAATPVTCLDRTSEGDDSYAVTRLAPGSSHDEIVAACNARYVAAGHTPPTDFALCVFPARRGQVGGAEMAIPSAVVVTPANQAGICQAAEYEPMG